MEHSLVVLVAAVSLLAVHLSHAANLKLPSTYPLCKRKDPNLNTCLTNALNNVLPQLRKGIPHLDVISVDPMPVSKIEIGQGSGAVAISLLFQDAIVHHLSEGYAVDCKSDLDNYVLDFGGRAGHLRLEANYEIDGKILVLPVTGKGRCNITFDDLVCRLGPKGKALQKDGETYFDVTDFPLDITSLGNLHFEFDNLFNGDKTLGEAMNKVMNDNWKELWAELKPSFQDTFGAIFKEFSRRIFGKVPMKEIFLE